MRPYKSIFIFAARQSIKPLLLCILALIAVQVIQFMVQMPSVDTLAGLLDGLAFSFGIILSVMWVAIIATQGNMNSNIGYTMRRLGISQNKMALMFGLNMILCLVIFWAVELLLLVGLSQFYFQQFPSEVQGSIFLVNTSSDFFYRILPLQGWMGWSNLVMGAIAIATSNACSVMQRWNGRKDLSVHWFMCYMGLVFVQSESSAIWNGFAVITMLVLLIIIMGVQNNEDERA